MNKVYRENYSSDESSISDQESNEKNDDAKDTQIEGNMVLYEQLPPCQPLAMKHYSLEADYILGWRPKLNAVSFYQLLPLRFQFELVDCLRPSKISEILDMKSSSTKIKNQSPQKSISYLRPFAGMNSQNNRTNNLTFDSQFEGGNLDCVIQTGINNYDLFMRVDSNTRGHFQWFYFKITGAHAGQIVTLNICNFTKSKSLYTRGMRPYVCSQKQGKWKQAGTVLGYSKNLLQYGQSQEDLVTNKEYYRLSYQYQFLDDDDVVSFAYCVPYTYTKLQNYIKQLKKSYEHLMIFKEHTLATSLGGLNTPYLEITDFSEKESLIKHRKTVLISGRVHPGESNSSFIIEGLITKLLSSQSAELRNQYIFKIVPMLNPDGVVLGNYRTGLAGKDLNRVFAQSDKILFPTVAGLEKLVFEKQKKSKDNIILFLDIHGHSLKKNAFTYGPSFSIFDPRYYECRLFSRILAEHCDMFRYYSCIFRISEGKQTTARAVFFQKYNISNSFTLEASNYSYYRDDHISIDFESNHWIQIGENIVASMKEYLAAMKLVNELQTIKINSNKTNQVEQGMAIEKFRNTESREKKRRNSCENRITQLETVKKKQQIHLREKTPDESHKSEVLSKKKVLLRPKTIDRSSSQNGQNATSFGFQETFELNSLLNNFHTESDGFSEGDSDNESKNEDYDQNYQKDLKQILIKTHSPSKASKISKKGVSVKRKTRISQNKESQQLQSPQIIKQPQTLLSSIHSQKVCRSVPKTIPTESFHKLETFVQQYPQSAKKIVVVNHNQNSPFRIYSKPYPVFIQAYQNEQFSVTSQPQFKEQEDKRNYLEQIMVKHQKIPQEETISFQHNSFYNNNIILPRYKQNSSYMSSLSQHNHRPTSSCQRTRVEIALEQMNSSTKEITPHSSISLSRTQQGNFSSVTSSLVCHVLGDISQNKKALSGTNGFSLSNFNQQVCQNNYNSNNNNNSSFIGGQKQNIEGNRNKMVNIKVDSSKRIPSQNSFYLRRFDNSPTRSFYCDSASKRHNYLWKNDN